ncbi:MAG: PAS domain S-box protein [Cyanobacteria bacterium SZAS LIN-3]|nr:PAS domain S-box protein [Cyanobacteria bacterium SZAS LIN-3]MBS2005583.1 PAS domain S-box protein [Cyanobacteria bacterium SZAS TMP-1]
MSLSQKVLFFLAILLAFQLIFISALAYLQFATEEQNRKAYRAQNLALIVNNLSTEIYIIMTSFDGGQLLKEGEKSSDRLTEALKKGAVQFARLKQLTQDNPVQHAQVLKAEKALTGAASIFAALKDDYRRTGDAGESGRIPLWIQMRHFSTVDIFKLLREIADQEQAIVEANPEKQAAFRSQLRTLLFASLAMTIFSILALAKYIITNITERLEVMSDNAYRLASNRPLNPPIEGSDEIAVLDRTFHDMAASLQQAAEKERAIVENAQDVICSFDNNGRFVSVNPAIEKMLGVTVEETAGIQVMELIVDEDASKALEYFGKVQEGKETGTLEVRMRTKSGGSLDTLWSAYWAEQEDTLFCVIHDMTVRKQAERLKEEVVVMVNHDLRTPLTTIQVSLELLKESERGRLSPKGTSLIEAMSLSCNQILRLTKDLLDLDRLESGRLELDIENCNLGVIAQRAIELTQGLAHKNQIVVRTDVHPLIVRGDSQRLEQVVTNMLANAMKYSPVGSQVQISVRPSLDRKMAMVAVNDQGPGIPNAMKSQVFDRYRQVKENLGQVKDGSGLGLAICKALVEQHGGKIWVEGDPGQGSTFIFTVPLVG